MPHGWHKRYSPPAPRYQGSRRGHIGAQPFRPIALRKDHRHAVTLSLPQLFDFELIKRKYANIVDILSYDDLLSRLSKIIEKFRKTV